MCGHVVYSSANLPDTLTNCHCLTCRKLSGAAFLTFMNLSTSSITWKSGPESMKTTRYSDIADRTHCAECGTPISMQYKFQPGRISITVGSINEESVKGQLPAVGCHIFVAEGEKAAWYVIPDDGIPRYSHFPIEFQKKIDARKLEVRASGSS